MSLDTSLFERRRPARQRRNSRSPEPRVPAVRQGRTCARNAFGGCPCVCSLVCGRAYAHPNVSATLPSKGKRVRYLGLARARITRQACSYAFAHEMHAHSQPPVTPSRLAKNVAYRLVRKRTDSMLRAACLRWNCTCHGILHSHIPSASTGNQCRYVCVCVHACVVYLRAR